MRRLLFPALLTLAGCMQAPTGAPQPGHAPEVTARHVAPLSDTLPPMKAFSATRISAPARPNRQIARDFLDLSFRLESGRTLPVMTRFEGPVTLRMTDNAPTYLQEDLDRLLRRLRVEARINIRQVDGAEPASINLEIIPKRRLQAIVPQAACFVAPNVTGWEQFKRLRRAPETDWTQMTTRRHMAVFIPGDVSPQEMRDCLHEEIAQALGPVNDLYRLPDSVFNDDNFHTVLTGFDMLILRAYYSPALRSGMTRNEVATRLPGILARMNPRGGQGAPARSHLTPLAWKQAIETALGANVGKIRRQNAARKAVSIARTRGWQDTRMAFSLYALGRLSLDDNRDVALQAFREAEYIYRKTPGSDLQVAHMGVQLAAYTLSTGNSARAIEITNTHLPAVKQAENAALLATFLSAGRAMGSARMRRWRGGCARWPPSHRARKATGAARELGVT